MTEGGIWVKRFSIALNRRIGIHRTRNYKTHTPIDVSVLKILVFSALLNWRA
jgi:hypothetical protein